MRPSNKNHENSTQDNNENCEDIENDNKNSNNQKEQLVEQLSAYNEQIIAMNEELEQSFEEINKLNNRFANMINLVLDIKDKSLLNEEEFFSDLLSSAINIVPEADYGTICIINENYNCKFIDAVGHDLEILKNLNINKESLFNHKDKGIFNSKKYFINLDYLSREQKQNLLKGLKPIKKSLYINITVSEKVVGRIAIDIKKGSNKEFSDTTKKIMESFSTLTSSFFAFKRFDDLKTNFTKELITSIIKIMEMYDLYTKGHSENVAELASVIAEKMELPKKIIRDVYWSGLVHDIGKLLIPIDILNKKDKLSNEEYELIKKHPVWGYEALSSSDSLNSIAEYILHHHERWDGNGYPKGLSHNDIPLISQILSVADAWDAMLSKRSYREPLSKEEAKDEIKKNKGSQFSPKIVDVFIKIIKENKVKRLKNNVLNDKIKTKNKSNIQMNNNKSYEKLFEESNEAIAILDKNFNIIRANNYFRKMFKYKKSEIKGVNIKKLVPQDKTEETEEYIDKLIEGHNIETTTYRKKKSGDNIEVAIQAFPISLKNGNVGYYVIYRDISELENTKRKYKDIKGRYESIFQNKDTNMLIVDPDNGDIVDANPAAIDFYGYTKEQLINMKISEINIMSEKEINKKMKNAKSKNKLSFDFKHKLANGEIRDVKVYSQPITFGDKRYLYSIIHDITDRKQAERKLNKQKNLIQSTLDSLSANIVILDEKGVIKFTNKAWRDFARANNIPLNKVGKGINYLKVTREAEGEWSKKANKAYQGIKEIMNREKDQFTLVYPCHSPEEKRWFKMKVTPFKGEGPYSVVISHQNFTEGKLKEQKIKTQNQKLKKQKAYFEQLFKNSNEGIVLLNNKNQVLKCNQKFTEIFGYNESEIRMKDIDEFILSEDYIDEGKTFTNEVKKGNRITDEVIRKTKCGKNIHVSLNAFPIKLSADQIGIYAVYNDITKRKKEEEKIKFLSFHDQLTNLYNRRYFENEMERLNRSRKLPISIIVADIDDLKHINDSYGHKTGDKYIKKISDVINQTTRHEDIVARIGGDEFAIILPESDIEVAQKLCQRIKVNCNQFKHSNVLPEPLRISLGYATAQTEKQDLNETFKVADRNMYEDKKGNRD